jgi:Holliday junction resolvase RusA-like endonuclease
VILVLPGTMPSLNEVIAAAKSHHGAYSSMKKKLTMSVAMQARAAGMKPVTKPVKVICRWFEPSRRRDVDNVAHGCKYILDGLCEGGVLVDDSQRHVPQIQHYFDIDKDNPRVEVELVEL